MKRIPLKWFFQVTATKVFTQYVKMQSIHRRICMVANSETQKKTQVFTDRCQSLYPTLQIISTIVFTINF